MDINPNPVQHHNDETHSFYLFVIIIAFAVVVLQPLAMLLAIFFSSSFQ